MDSNERLLELFNRSNNPPKEFTNRNILLHNPVPQPVGESGSDTRMVVDGIPGFGYYNGVEVTYKRIPLSDFLAGTTVRSITPITMEGFIGQLNALYGTYIELRVEDLEEFEIPEIAQDETVAISLKAKAESIGFVGEQEVSYTYGRPMLNQVVLNTDLDVLSYIAVKNTEDFKSALHITWGIDFTSLRDAIKPQGNGRMTDWVALQEAAQFLGIPPWAEATVTDISTASDPKANPKFDRVVIQRAVVSGGMKGDLYFHYNLFDEV